MRTLVTRVAVILILAVVVLGVALVALGGGQPARVIKYSGPIPDVPCAAGQSPEKSPFCQVTPPPNASKVPDTTVPPDPSKTP